MGCVGVRNQQPGECGATADVKPCGTVVSSLKKSSLLSRHSLVLSLWLLRLCTLRMPPQEAPRRRRRTWVNHVATLNDVYDF